MKGKKVRPIQAVATWVRRQPPKVKALLAVVSAAAALVFLKMVVEDHDNLFVAAEAVHAIGISVLIYKLTKVKTCAGLSLKSQILTALFLAVRLYCSFVMEYDIHTVLDLATFVTTIWVIYMIRFKLKSSYMEDRDNMPIYYVVIPCAVISLFIHPSTSHHIFNRICWAFCVYVEAISILPQLRVMQNAKIVEPFTAHYVFALGVARFMTCAHWVLQVGADTAESKFVPKMDCGAACAVRCRLASRQKMCKRACGTCCARCNCVPPGTSGNQKVCPCYYTMTTHGGRRKCP